MAIKNFWSLNVDELLVADKIRAIKGKKGQVFFPLDSTLANIDLMYVDLDSHGAVTVQVKGSRTYQPSNSEKNKWGAGGFTWFLLDKHKIFQPKNKVALYVFVLHSIQDGSEKKEIVTDFLVMTADDLRKICLKKKGRKSGKSYDFFIWIDSKGRRAFDYERSTRHMHDMTKYLDNWGLLKTK